jgi:hypothetical protein
MSHRRQERHHARHVEQDAAREQEVGGEDLDAEVRPDPVGARGGSDSVDTAVELEVPADVADGVDGRGPVLAGEVQDLRRP